MEYNDQFRLVGWEGARPTFYVDVAGFASGVVGFSGADPTTYNRNFGGTAAAASIGAGAASLLEGEYPALTGEDIDKILEVTARDADQPGRDNITGTGAIDAGAALAFVQSNDVQRQKVEVKYVADEEVSGDRVRLNGVGYLEYTPTLCSALYGKGELHRFEAYVEFPNTFVEAPAAWVRWAESDGLVSEYRTDPDDDEIEVYHNPFRKRLKVTSVYNDGMWVEGYYWDKVEWITTTGSSCAGGQNFHVPQKPDNFDVAYTAIGIEGAPPPEPLSVSVGCAFDHDGDGYGPCVISAFGGGGAYDYDWNFDRCNGSDNCQIACGGFGVTVTVSSATGETKSAFTTSGQCSSGGCGSQGLTTNAICTSPLSPESGLYTNVDEQSLDADIESTEASLSSGGSTATVPPNSNSPRTSAVQTGEAEASGPPSDDVWLADATEVQRLRRLYSLLLLEARVQQMRGNRPQEDHLNVFSGSRKKLRALFTDYASASPSAGNVAARNARDASRQILVENLIRSSRPDKALQRVREYLSEPSWRRHRAHLHIRRSTALQQKGQFDQALEAIHAAERQWLPKGRYTPMRKMLLRLSDDAKWEEAGAAGAANASSLSKSGAQEPRPEEVALQAPYPNPAGNERVTVSLALPAHAKVRAAVYDVLGRRVEVLADRNFAAGRPELILSTGDLSSGLYLIRVEVESASGQNRTFTEEITVVQ